MIIPLEILYQILIWNLQSTIETRKNDCFLHAFLPKWAYIGLESAKEIVWMDIIITRKLDKNVFWIKDDIVIYLANKVKQLNGPFFRNGNKYPKFEISIKKKYMLYKVSSFCYGYQ